MRRGSILLALCVILGISCKSKRLEVKFRNNTFQDFDSLRVWIGTKDLVLGELKKGKKTSKVTTESTYRYFPITAYVKNDSIKFSPFCYSGERQIKSGKLIITILTTEGTNGQQELVTKMKRRIF